MKFYGTDEFPIKIVTFFIFARIFQYFHEKVERILLKICKIFFKTKSFKFIKINYFVISNHFRTLPLHDVYGFIDESKEFASAGAIIKD